MPPIKKNENSQVEMSSCAAFELIGKELVENLKTKDPNNLEIFERYSHALRLKMHFKEDVFAGRFVRGYKVLLDELK
jgi:hypothetical protein